MTFWLALGTFGLFLVAVAQCGALLLQYKALEKTDETTHSSFVMANRAKITVEEAILATALDPTQRSILVITHQNKGRDTALELATGHDINFLPRIVKNGPLKYSIAFPPNNFCDTRSKTRLSRALPEADYHTEILFLEPSDWNNWNEAATKIGAESAFEAVKVGNATVYVQGCDTFKTLDREEIHTFCYYYDGESKTPDGSLKLQRCPSSSEKAQ